MTAVGLVLPRLLQDPGTNLPKLLTFGIFPLGPRALRTYSNNNTKQQLVAAVGMHYINFTLYAYQ